MLDPKLQVNSIHLQERDFALLRGLFESRVMTSSHMSTLFFEGKKEAAKQRLRKLKKEGLLGERKRRVNEPSVLFLTKKAFGLLHERGILAEYPSLNGVLLRKRAHVSDSTLNHELDVMDIKAAFHSAIRGMPALKIDQLSTWPLLHQFQVSGRHANGPDSLVKPDAFLSIHETTPDEHLDEHSFFLEIDRSNETQDRLVRKADAYVAFYRSGGFAARQGASPADLKDYPFRVLMVFKNAERRNNTAERLLQNNPPIFTHVWLSTFAEVKANPLGAVWITPRDYRSATSGTRFDTEHKSASWRYRRQTEREMLVESKIRKQALLAES